MSCSVRYVWSAHRICGIKRIRCRYVTRRVRDRVVLRGIVAVMWLFEFVREIHLPELVTSSRLIGCVAFTALTALFWVVHTLAFTALSAALRLTRFIWHWVGCAIFTQCVECVRVTGLVLVPWLVEFVRCRCLVWVRDLQTTHWVCDF